MVGVECEEVCNLCRVSSTLYRNEAMHGAMCVCGCGIPSAGACRLNLGRCCVQHAPQPRQGATSIHCGVLCGAGAVVSSKKQLKKAGDGQGGTCAGYVDHRQLFHDGVAHPTPLCACCLASMNRNCHCFGHSKRRSPPKILVLNFVNKTSASLPTNTNWHLQPCVCRLLSPSRCQTATRNHQPRTN